MHQWATEVKMLSIITIRFMNGKSWLFVLLVLCFDVFMSALLVAAEVDDLVEKFHNSRQMFFGKVYEYEVDCEEVEGSGALESIGEGLELGARVVYIGRYDANSYSIPFRIEHYVESNKEPYLDQGRMLVHWDGFNGKESRSFSRVIFGDGTSMSEHICYVLAGVGHTLFKSDPFVGSLFYGAYDNSRFGHSASQKETTKPPSIVTKEEIPGLGTTFKATDQETGTMGLVFSSGPEFHHIRMFLPGIHAEKSEIQSLEAFGEVRYPSTGAFDARIWKGTYRLKSVKPLPEGFDAWFSEWPRGSVVFNKIDGSTLRIPYNVDESAKVRKFLDGTAALRSVQTADHFPWLVIINSVMAVVIVAAILLRRRLLR